jgi:DNA-binding winged helix-turn-helix (wHTH) protein
MIRGHNVQVVRFATFEVDLRSGEVHKSGVKLKLGGQPFQVLAILLEQPGEVVTREELHKRLWPDTFVDVDNNLNTAINKIREVLGDSAENPRFVETLPRRGYRFIAPIDGVKAFMVSVRSTTEMISCDDSRNVSATSRTSRIAVAVVPLRVLTTHEEDEYLGIALVDALINHLSNGTGLLVRSISAVAQDRHYTFDRLRLARDLGAQISVDGSIQRIDDRIRVHLQISSVEDSALIASLKDESELHELFALQDRLGESLLRSLGSTHCEVAKMLRTSLLLERRKTPLLMNSTCERRSCWLDPIDGGGERLNFSIGPRP